METLYDLKENRQLRHIMQNYLNGSKKRILFACIPADGHFNPLTGLAVHLQNTGYDVRWYTAALYAGKLQSLNIPHYSFKKALDVNGDNLEQVFPERKKIKGLIKKLRFDMINTFINRSVEYFEDIKEIYRKFPFDAVVCDCAFTAIPFIKEKIKVPVISIGVLPLTETSKDLAPAGFGLMPAGNFFGRRKQDILRFIADKIFFRHPTKLMSVILHHHGIKMEGSNIFDMMVKKSTLLLQFGSPGFEYKRSDLGRNIRFIGPLLPLMSKTKKWDHPKLSQYTKVLLVTQGTVEKNSSKLIIPTLEAFKNSEYLVIATTSGAHTNELRNQFNYDNIIIEDFIPFPEIMPFANVYITNGGYGGVMLSIRNQLPLVAAGVHEGKAEINARVGYFKIGVNLGTENPTPQQLKTAVEQILTDGIYQHNIERLSDEFDRYNANELCAEYIREVVSTHYQPVF